MAIARQDQSRPGGSQEGDFSRTRGRRKDDHSMTSGMTVGHIDSMGSQHNGLDHVTQYSAQKDPSYQLVYMDGENHPAVQNSQYWRDQASKYPEGQLKSRYLGRKDYNEVEDSHYSDYLSERAALFPEGQDNSRYFGRKDYRVVQDSDFSDYWVDQAPTYPEGQQNPVLRKDYSVVQDSQLYPLDYSFVQYSDYSNNFNEQGNSSRDHSNFLDSREVERVDYSDYSDYLDIKLGYKEGTIPEDQAAFYSSWRDPLDPLTPSYSSDLSDYPGPGPQTSPVAPGTTLGPGGVVQRPGILTEMLDWLALALGDYSVLEWRPSSRRGEEERRRRLEKGGRRKTFMEREEGWRRRTANFTEVLHSKLPDGQVKYTVYYTLDTKHCMVLTRLLTI